MNQDKHCYYCKKLNYITTVEENNISYDVWSCPSPENRHKNMGADCNNFIKSDVHIHKYLKDKLNESEIL